MQVHLRSARLKGPWRIYKHPRVLTHLGVLAHSLNGSVIVTRSIEMEEPVIYVSMNYRYVIFARISTETAVLSMLSQSLG